MGQRWWLVIWVEFVLLRLWLSSPKHRFWLDIPEMSLKQTSRMASQHSNMIVVFYSVVYPTPPE
jgi:hypothetical protein